MVRNLAMLALNLNLKRISFDVRASTERTLLLLTPCRRFDYLLP
jgi:hypothetical protein